MNMNNNNNNNHRQKKKKKEKEKRKIKKNRERKEVIHNLAVLLNLYFQNWSKFIFLQFHQVIL